MDKIDRWSEKTTSPAVKIAQVDFSEFSNILNRWWNQSNFNDDHKLLAQKYNLAIEAENEQRTNAVSIAYDHYATMIFKYLWIALSIGI